MMPYPGKKGGKAIHTAEGGKEKKKKRGVNRGSTCQIELYVRLRREKRGGGGRTAPPLGGRGEKRQIAKCPRPRGVLRPGGEGERGKGESRSGKKKKERTC